MRTECRIFLCLATTKCQWIVVSDFNLRIQFCICSTLHHILVHYCYMHVLLHQQPMDWLFAGVHTMYVTYNINIYSFVILHFLMKNYIFLHNKLNTSNLEWWNINMLFKAWPWSGLYIFHRSATSQAFRPQPNGTNTPRPTYKFVGLPNLYNWWYVSCSGITFMAIRPHKLGRNATRVPSLAKIW